MKDTNFSMHILQSIFRISLLFGCIIKVQGCSSEIFINARNTRFEGLCDFDRTWKKPNRHEEPDHQQGNQNTIRHETRDNNCTFVIKAPEGYSIELRLRYNGDWVDVRDGRVQNARVIGRYQDTAAREATVKSSGWYIRATFHSEAMRHSSDCSYANYKVFRHQTKPDSLNKASSTVTAAKPQNAAMLTAGLTWLGFIILALVIGCAVGYAQDVMKKRRNERNSTQVSEVNTSISVEVFAVEVELPNYDSPTNGSAQTETCASATSEVDGGPCGRDSCAKQSYLLYVRNTRDLMPGLDAAASQVDGSENVSSDQQDYLVRVSHANNDIVPPPLYEVDNPDSSPSPSYEGDNQDDSPPPSYEGDNQDDNRPSLLYEGDNHDNSLPLSYEGDNRNNSPPPSYEGDNQDISPSPLYEDSN